MGHSILLSTYWWLVPWLVPRCTALGVGLLYIVIVSVANAELGLPRTVQQWFKLIRSKRECPDAVSCTL